MRTLSLLLLLFGTAASTGSIVANLATASTNEALSLAMLSAQTEQANDINPNRGGGRRRAVDDTRLDNLGESSFDASLM